MAKSLKASGLAHVRMDFPSADSAVLILTDTKKKAFATLINPEGLNAILSPLLQCASKWADKPDLAIETLVGPKNALVAKKIVFEKGRDSAECAVRLYLGQKMELTFLIPVDEVISGTANLVRLLDIPPPEDSGPTTH